MQLCVVGGGLAGLFAAVSAARHGAKVLLMHDRPVLGGNASSEIRMWVRGAAGKDNRETGLIQEAEMENIYRNPAMNYSIWDTVLYQLAIQEENLTLLLNTSCLGCEMREGRISSITGWERPHDGEANTVSLPEGEALIVTIKEPCHGLRLALDPDFSRESITRDHRYQKYAMRTHIDWPQAHLNMPARLLRSCTVTIRRKDGAQTTFPIKENRRVVMVLPLPQDTEEVALTQLASWGDDGISFFSVDAAR